jgi:hypothetical protein
MKYRQAHNKKKRRNHAICQDCPYIQEDGLWGNVWYTSMNVRTYNEDGTAFGWVVIKSCSQCGALIILR